VGWIEVNKSLNAFFELGREEGAEGGIKERGD
jgi:hypothetical protein